MLKHIVISALGEDKPGIVKAMSKLVLDMGGSITDSQMSVLGGEFALIMLVEGGEEAIKNIEASLPEMQDTLSLTIITKRTKPKMSSEHQMPYVVNVVAMDNPGIVHDVTGYLAKFGVNVEELNTSSYFAAHTGAPMFALDMGVSVPKEVNISEFKNAFFEFCEELNLDGAISPIK